MIKITKAKISDAHEIRKLEEKVWKGKNVSGRYDVGNLIRFCYAFAAKENLKIVGAVLSYKTSDNCIYIADWFVDEKYRGHGIGKK